MRDVDDSTSTARFLAAAVHHAKLPLATVDLDSDSIVVVATKDAKKLGLAPIAAKPLPAPRPVKPAANEARFIATEDAAPHKGYRCVIAGEKRGDEVFGVVYGEAYLKYTFYDELRGRVVFTTRKTETKGGFGSRARAVRAAERELERRIKADWQRVSGARLHVLEMATKK